MRKGLNKLMEAAMAVLQATPEQKLKIVVLNKALFYADLYALRDLGRTITGQTYVALPQGPVVESYAACLVKALSDAKLAEQVVDGSAKPVRVVNQLKHFERIDANELNIASGLGRSVNQFTSSMMSAFSHENPGWAIAIKKARSGMPAPTIDMRIAMQQLTDIEDEDPWLTAEPDEALKNEIAKAHRATVSW